MVYLFALSAILVPTFLGFLFLRLLDREKKLGILEGLGLSYGLGLGMTAIIMTLLSLAGVSFNIFNILMPFVLIIVLAGIFNKIFQKPEKARLKVKPGCEKMSKLEIFFLCAILFEISFAFFVSMIKPMESWDAVAHWGLKAKMLYFLKGLPLNLFLMPCIKDVLSTGDYPWLWPFSQAYTYNFIGYFNDFAVKIITPFFFAACLAIFYSILRRINLKRQHAIIFTFFLASVPHFKNYASNGYADLMLGFYYSVGFLYLYLWFNENNRIYFLMSAIFTALACYVKCDGIFLAGISAMTFLSFALSGGAKNRRRIFNPSQKSPFIFYIFILALLSLPMLLLKQGTFAGLSNHTVNMKMFSAFKLKNLWKIFPVMYAYQEQFFNIKSWNLTWVLFLVSAFLAFIRGMLFKKELKFLTLAIGLVFLAHISLNIISRDESACLKALSRQFLHFLPLVVFFIAYIFMSEDKRCLEK